MNAGRKTRTDFWALICVAQTGAYPIKDVHPTVDWLGQKTIFSSFDLKDEVFQVKLTEVLKTLTAKTAVLNLLQYASLTQVLKNSPGTF